MQKFSINQKSIESLLNYIRDWDIVIPEIQRPFVWDSVKVRNLMDSLYNGFPIGYIITWKNPNVKLKSWWVSDGKQVLIDWQQRITALMAAILWQEIVDDNYKKKRIIIAFNPISQEFKTLTSAIEKSNKWIKDISIYLTINSQLWFLKEYFKKNDYLSEDEELLVEQNLWKLSAIKTKDIWIIELNKDLDIEDVTEIFKRINSEWVQLEQADFAMSRIASYETINDSLFWTNLRKCIDYFAHIVKVSHYFEHIEQNDIEFSKTEYFQKIKWLKKFNDDLYKPDYKDILRVSFVKEFNRWKISDLVKLLSWQNFKTRSFDESVQEESFLRLKKWILDFVNENHFKRFLLIVKSLWIINEKLVNSQNILNFAYIVYLKLRKDWVDNNLIEKYTKQRLILSILTERYSWSPESKMDKDIKDINEKWIENVIKNIEDAELSDAYWNIWLIQNLDSSSISNPFLKLFFASQLYFQDKWFLSKDMTIQQLIEIRWDIHHIFPKDYLKKNWFNRWQYNKVANYVYLQQEINIKIWAKSPKEYFNELLEQCKNNEPKYGLITDKNKLLENMKQNAIPETIFNMWVDNYESFLEDRKKLIAQKLKRYWFDLKWNNKNIENILLVNDLLKSEESENLEFKSTLTRNIKAKMKDKIPENSVLKTIAWFNNKFGWILLIWIDDDKNILWLNNDYTLSNLKNIDKFELHLRNILKSRLKIDSWYLSMNIKIYFENIEWKDICIIEVLKWKKPIFTNEEKFYVRDWNRTIELKPSEISEYISNRFN